MPDRPTRSGLDAASMLFGVEPGSNSWLEYGTRTVL